MVAAASAVAILAVSAVEILAVSVVSAVVGRQEPAEVVRDQKCPSRAAAVVVPE